MSSDRAPQGDGPLIGDALARAMVGWGLSSFEAAIRIGVSVDDVRGALAGNVRLLSPEADEAVRDWVELIHAGHRVAVRV